MARPKTRSDVIPVRLPLEVFDEIQRRADAKGQPVRTWIEEWLVRSYQKTMQAAPTPPPGRDGHTEVTPRPKAAPKAAASR